jgi:hypothetical protein
MKSTLLKLLLAISVIAGCSAAPVDRPTVNNRERPTGTEFEEQEAELNAAPPAGYTIFPGGVRAPTACIYKFDQNAPMVQAKNADGSPKKCAQKSIKPAIKKTSLPVDSTLVGGASGELGAQAQALQPVVNYSFNVPSEMVAAYFGDTLTTQANEGQKSQANITHFNNNFAVPYGSSEGDQGQLIYITAQAAKWGGVYPSFTDRTAVAGAFLQYGNSWIAACSWQWCLFTYAQDGFGNYYVKGPVYDVGATTRLQVDGYSTHVADPYWGSVTRWHVSVAPYQGTLDMDFDYPDPMDMNFSGATMEFFNVPQSSRLFPVANQISFYVKHAGSPKGCVPGYGNLPWWYCGEAAMTPKWKWVGNGGTMPDYYWAGTQQGSEFVYFNLRQR